MSPSEFELRRALQPNDGEPGDALNVDALIGKARVMRHERRMRFASVAAAVVVVGAVGIGGATLYSNTGASKKSATSDTTMQSRPDRAAPLNPNAASSASAGGAVSGSSVCTSTGGTTVTATSVPPAPGGALQAGPVDTVVVCVIPAASNDGAAIPGTRPSTYTGSQAQQIADSVNAASATPIHTMCPMGGARGSGSLTLLFESQGAVTAAVIATQNASCSLNVTNGTTTRYNWEPPSFLAGDVGRIETGGPLTK